MEKMPQELVDNVVKYLSPQSRLNAMEAGFILPDQAVRHSQAWRKIFKNFDWLETAVWVGANPVLVGPKADAFLNNNDEPEIYLVLLPMDYSGDLQYHFSNSRCEYEQVFLDGLQEA
ncbi:hypothetical protein INS49_003954 [Diaporthe citri]|uniref:uncharacterized protein n=1 Tax=Diaporthe citri TaxID=83186 RepID=UPI001C825DF2|nr:uncharacterized protein INS49_003954 [Diaporthe citri]KAG6354873.1 hypothetical protein INS49_003954 [Diaporthe citri]